MEGRIEVVRDPVADALDDMAALGLHWTRNRDRGCMPNGIRAAMLLVARDALALADMEERKAKHELHQQMAQAFGFQTALQAGAIAGDGKPCPNDHDPDCRWPQCNCRTREPPNAGITGPRSGSSA